jgi:hypothetical protein
MLRERITAMSQPLTGDSTSLHGQIHQRQLEATMQEITENDIHLRGSPQDTCHQSNSISSTHNKVTIPPQELVHHPFRFPHLPPEIRLQIYKTYFFSLPPISVTESILSFALHTFINLTTSSPFFTSDIPLSMFYQNATFCFAGGEVMRKFAEIEGMRENVRNVRIMYGVEKEARGRGRDWVFLLGELFERLESVEFVVHCGSYSGGNVGIAGGGIVGIVDEAQEIAGGGDSEYVCEGCEGCEKASFVIWGKAVVDAMREAKRDTEGRGLRLRCMRGEGSVIESIC